mmetsp:Transcript_8552/g.13881  ORF Transcript_8552/g.13881 Transcript_8552/m.13881 type:complete len:93 (+) Transcript_8552:206-484(+)
MRKFRQLLLHYENVYGPESFKIHIVNEPYTSQQCGNCENMYTPQGQGDTYACPHFGYKTLRDINGARNILIRALTLGATKQQIEDLKKFFAI